jgi:hypothetical protein
MTEVGPSVSEKSIASGVANTIYKKVDKSISERIGKIIFQKLVAFTRFAIMETPGCIVDKKCREKIG